MQQNKPNKPNQLNKGNQYKSPDNPVRSDSIPTIEMPSDSIPGHSIEMPSDSIPGHSIEMPSDPISGHSIEMPSDPIPGHSMEMPSDSIPGRSIPSWKLLSSRPGIRQIKDSKSQSSRPGIRQIKDSKSQSSRSGSLQTKNKKLLSKLTKNNKKWMAAALVEVLVLLLMSFAWYFYMANRKVLSEDREVMLPYYLYLVDKNGTDQLQLTVGNLHPGETKQVVFGVSNQAPSDGNEMSNNINISKNSIFNYELELAYTQNLPVDYQVYALTETASPASDGSTVTVEWEDAEKQTVSQSFTKALLNKKTGSENISTINNEKMYGDKVNTTVNLGQYDIYDKTSGANFDLTTKVNSEGTVDFDLDYYLVEIQWKDGITFSDYLKETDLVYVIVNAMQLEPTEATTEAAQGE